MKLAGLLNIAGCGCIFGIVYGYSLDSGSLWVAPILWLIAFWSGFLHYYLMTENTR